MQVKHLGSQAEHVLFEAKYLPLAHLVQFVAEVPHSEQLPSQVSQALLE